MMLKRCWLAFAGLSLFLSFPLSATEYKYIWAKIGYARILVEKNDAPAAVADAFTVTEDTSQVLDVLSNDGDEVMSTLSVAIQQTASHGTLTETTMGKFSYRPADNFHGTDSFTYTLTDEKGKVSTEATVNITVASVNDRPNTSVDSYTINEDNIGVTLNVLSNDNDVEGQPLTVELYGTNTAHQWQNRTLNVSADGKTFVYQPPANANGTDWFTYRATDSEGGFSDITRVEVNVTPHNDAPLASDINTTTPEDIPLTIAPQYSDIDNDQVQIQITSQPSKGSATIHNGKIQFSPDLDATGQTSFNYLVNDGTVNSNEATVVINVTPVNDAPTVQSRAPVTLNEDTPGIFTGLDGVSDVDGDTLTLVGASAGVGTAQVRNQSEFTYTPPKDYYTPPGVTVPVTLEISDGKELVVSDWAFEIAPIKDVPRIETLLWTGFEQSSQRNYTKMQVRVYDNDRQQPVSVKTSGLFVGGLISLGYIDAYSSDGYYIYEAGQYELAEGHYSPIEVVVVDNDGDSYVDHSYFNVTYDGTTPNSPPSPEDDIFPLVIAGYPTELDVLSNDNDVDGDDIHVNDIVDDNNNDRYLLERGDDDKYIIIKPEVCFEGGVTFKYNATDGYNVSAMSNVDASIYAFNNGIEAVPENVAVSPGSFVFNANANNTVSVTWSQDSAYSYKLLVNGEIINDAIPAYQNYNLTVDSPGNYAVSVAACTPGTLDCGCYSDPVAFSAYSLTVENIRALNDNIFTGSSATMTWDNNKVNGQYWQVERKLNTGSYTLVANSLENNLFSETLNSTGEYRYRVKTCLANGTCGNWSEEVPVTVAQNTVTVDGQRPVNPSTYTEDTAGTVIALAAGEFRVDESGASTWHIPFTLPQGIAGVTPELGIGYSSQAGNGHLGLGWAVSGLSAISRCRATLEQDGFSGYINFDHNDRFCLDGQKLIAVSKTNSNADTAHSSDTALQEFRTEIDSKTRIVSFGSDVANPDYFVVSREDGSVSYYGAKDISGDISTTNVAVQKSVSGNMSWLLVSTSDNFGKLNPTTAPNHIKFTYKDFAGLVTDYDYEVVLQNVQYSGNKVEFTWSDSHTPARLDTETRYSHGSAVHTTKLLSKVTISNHAGADLREYGIDYIAERGRSPANGASSYADADKPFSLIWKVTECGFSGTTKICLAPTEFDWYDTPVGGSFGSSAGPVTFGSGKFETAISVDLNGDGFSDMLTMTSIDDISAPFAREYQVHRILNTNGSFGSAFNILTFSYDAGDEFQQPPQLIPADIDGDGIPEIFYFENDPDSSETRAVWRYLKSHSGNGAPVFNSRSSYNLLANNAELTAQSTGYKLKFIDVDGDARSDLVYNGHHTNILDALNLRINNGEGDFSAEFAADLSGFDNCHDYVDGECIADGVSSSYNPAVFLYLADSAPADFNGDGRADIGVFQFLDSNTGIADFVIGQRLFATSLTKVVAAETPGVTEDFYKLEITDLIIENLPGLDASTRNYDIGSPETVYEHFTTQDFNADGLSDAFYIHAPITQSQVEPETAAIRFSGSEESATVSLWAPDHNYTAPAAEDILLFQAVDVNKDHRIDLLYYDKRDGKTGWYSIIQQSDGTFAAPTLLYYTVNYTEGSVPVIGDWNADGEPGFGYIKSDNRQFTYATDNFGGTTVPARLLKTVTNGFGLTTSVNYKQMTDSTVYTKGSGAEDLRYGRCRMENDVSVANCTPVFDITGPGFLVSDVTSEVVGFKHDPADKDINFTQDTDATVSVSYFYEGLRAQAGGRGMLGFEKISTTSTTPDSSQEITTYTRYRQDFPFIGMPARTVQYIGDRDTTVTPTNTLSDSENQYDVEIFRGATVNNEVVADQDSTFFPFIDISTEKLFGANDGVTATAQTGTVVTDNDYVVFSDNHANVGKMTVFHYEGSGTGTLLKSTESTNQYDADSVSNWWLGRITESDVKHSYAGTNDYRLSQFTYNPSNGLLEREIVLPHTASTDGIADERILLTTLHCYDAVGNETDTFTYSIHHNVTCDTTTPPTSFSDYQVYRHKSFEYDGADRYLLKVSNAYFTEQRFSEYNKFGQPTTIVDADGLKTTIWYDSLGMQYASQKETGERSRLERALASSVPGSFGAPDTFKPATAYFIEKVSSEDGVDAAAPTTFKYYDRMGRVVAQVTEAFDNNGGSATHNYIYKRFYFDKWGRQTGESAPSFATTGYGVQTRYDFLGRITDTYVNHGHSNKLTSSVDYGTNGLTVATSVTYRGNGSINQTVIKTRQKNILGELTQVTESDFVEGNSAATLATLSYTYHPGGSLHFAGLSGEQTETVFDDYGRKISMKDKDKGDWSYTYNALGELVSQTKHSSTGDKVVTAFTRDAVGRTVRRQDYHASALAHISQQEEAIFVFDAREGYKHQLLTECFATTAGAGTCDGSKPVRVFGYDAKGRPSTVTKTIGSGAGAVTVVSRTTYDEFGRIYQHFEDDSSKHGIQNEYGNGYLLRQKEARFGSGSNGLIYHEVRARDAFGNVTKYEQNNGLVTTENTFDPVTGMQTENKVLSDGTTIQSNDYRFDAMGNLRKRFRLSLFQNTAVTHNNVTQGISRQGFRYDAFNRLTDMRHNSDSNQEPWATRQYQEWTRYAVNGNMLYKADAHASGAATYCYDSSRPHAVTDVVADGQACTTQAWQYDAWGNMTSGRGRTINYSLFDKATYISSGNSEWTSFAYDVKRQRYERITEARNSADQIEATRTLYFGSQEKVYEKDSGGVWQLKETRRNLPSAVQTLYPTMVANTFYHHKDTLGSINTVTNDDGLIVQKLYFDAWGKKALIPKSDWQWVAQRKAAQQADLANILDITPRGFTGHEHVDHADIIHMNGRIYDPTLGRFLQADPFIQAPDNAQSYNRYSYVMNNPLSATDPSGYIGIFKKITRQIIRAAVKVFGADVTNILGNIGSAFCGPFVAFCAAAWNYEFTRATGGNRGQALSGAFFAGAGAFFGANFKTGSAFGNFVLAGVVGGAISHARGGNFGHGFWAAGLNQAIGGADMTSNPVANVAISAVIGGTISKVTGGKFANGAGSAAFAAALRQDWSSRPKRLVEGSPEWEAREQAAMDAEIAAIEASFGSEKDLYAANTVFRALTPEQRLTYDMGLGIFARNRGGTLTPEQHVALGSVGSAASPWISTSTQMMVVDNGYRSTAGVVMIDLSLVENQVVTFNTIGDVWANNLNFEQKLAYIRAVWAQEVLVKGHIPQEAMTLIDDGK